MRKAGAGAATRGWQSPLASTAAPPPQATGWADSLKFTSSGSEATYFALRLARAATGRDRILKFEGAYHGHHDYVMMGTTPQSPVEFPTALPDSAGIPAALRQEVLIAPFNDLATTVELLGGMGATVTVDERMRIEVDATTVKDCFAPYELVKTMRASILVLGPLVARYGRAEKRIHRILDGTALSRGVSRRGLAAILASGLPLVYLVAGNE